MLIGMPGHACAVDEPGVNTVKCPIHGRRRGDQNETAALWQANAALREAEFGNSDRARKEAEAALALAP
jgi:hypothetical protein